MHPILTGLFAQTASDGAQQAPGGLLASPLVMIALMFVIFYFVVFRPQGKQRKQHEVFLSGLKKGDEVYTNSGIVGVVQQVDQARKTVMLDIGGGNKIRVIQSYIAGAWKENVQPDATKAEAKK